MVTKDTELYDLSDGENSVDLPEPSSGDVKPNKQEFFSAGVPKPGYAPVGGRDGAGGQAEVVQPISSGVLGGQSVEQLYPHLTHAVSVSRQPLGSLWTGRTEAAHSQRYGQVSCASSSCFMGSRRKESAISLLRFGYWLFPHCDPKPAGSDKSK